MNWKEKTNKNWKRREITNTNPQVTDTTSANTVKEMKIDEEKQYRSHKLEKTSATMKIKNILKS